MRCMADRWRVTIKAAWLRTSWSRLRLTRCLAWALIESAVLLSIRTGVPSTVVWVTPKSRCRFRDRPVLLFLSRALHFRGRCRTKERVSVAPVVVTILLLVVLSCLQWTPLTIALANRRALRNITVTRSCNLLN